MESRRIHNSTALTFWYFWVKPKVRNTVNIEVVWIGRGFAICLARDQRIIPYRLGQHTNSLVELVETNILFFTGFAFDKLRPTTGRQANPTSRVLDDFFKLMPDLLRS